jgi:hypothetical protein
VHDGGKKKGIASPLILKDNPAREKAVSSARDSNEKGKPSPLSTKVTPARATAASSSRDSNNKKKGTPSSLNVQGSSPGLNSRASNALKALIGKASLALTDKIDSTTAEKNDSTTADQRSDEPNRVENANVVENPNPVKSPNSVSYAEMLKNGVPRPQPPIKANTYTQPKFQTFKILATTALSSFAGLERIKREAGDCLKFKVLPAGVQMKAIPLDKDSEKIFSCYARNFSWVQMDKPIATMVVATGVPTWIPADKIKCENLVYSKRLEFFAKLKDGTFKKLPSKKILIRVNGDAPSKVTVPLVGDFPTEAYKASPTQCYNCMGYGHVAKKCKNPKKCPHCGAAHGSKDCQKKQDKAVCTNCNGEHKAYSKSCPVYKKQAERAAQHVRTLPKPTEAQVPSEERVLPPQPTTSSTTWVLNTPFPTPAVKSNSGVSITPPQLSNKDLDQIVKNIEEKVVARIQSMMTQLIKFFTNVLGPLIPGNLTKDLSDILQSWGQNTTI